MELLSQIYFWSLFSAGIGISIWGFKRKKSWGYLFIAVFFLSPFVGLLLEEISYQIHKEEIERINEENNEEMELMISAGNIPIVVEENISLPVFESLLVLGLFFTVRNQKTEPVTGGNA